MKLKALSVIGTRPEAIKMAPVVRRLGADARFESRLCATSQHRELLESALAPFHLRPHHDLQIMAPGQELAQVAARVLHGVAEVIRVEQPDVLLVHGDTSTCMAAALAGFFARVPVAHVEAGLRSHDLERPFPEELNRILADRMSAFCFAPTERARRNLLAEGVDDLRIEVTGNTGIDALLDVRRRVLGRPIGDFAGELGFYAALLDEWEGPIVLVTGHRRESFGEGIDGLCSAIRQAAGDHPDWLFVYPVHPNPNVRRPVGAALAGMPNVVLIEPLSYEPFVWLMHKSRLIVTDSGGVQEEAPAIGKPVLVTRDTTERPEAVEAGTVRLVGTDRDAILASLEELLGDAARYESMARAHSPYGDGRAAERIVEGLARGLARNPVAEVA